MVQYYVHEKMILDVAKSYQTIYDTYNKSDSALNLDPTGELKAKAFENFIIYLMVSPFTNEKVDLLNIAESLYGRELDQNELISRYMRKFLSSELLPFND